MKKFTLKNIFLVLIPFILIIVVSAIIPLFSGTPLENIAPFLMCGLVGLVVLSFIIYRRLKILFGNIGKGYKEKYLEKWLNETFQGVQYDASGYIATSTMPIQNSQVHHILNIPIWEDYDTIHGQDYFYGITQGNIPFEYCDLLLTDFRGSYKNSHTKTVFNGGLIVTVSEKMKGSKSPVCICSKEIPLIEEYQLGKKTVETENLEFNKRFYCYANDIETVFYIVTPILMEALISLEDKIGKFYLYLSENGQVVLAVPKLNLFKAKLNKNKMKESIQQDINTLVSLVSAVENKLDSGIGIMNTANFNINESIPSERNGKPITLQGGKKFFVIALIPVIIFVTSMLMFQLYNDTIGKDNELLSTSTYDPAYEDDLLLRNGMRTQVNSIEFKDGMFVFWQDDWCEFQIESDCSLTLNNQKLTPETTITIKNIDYNVYKINLSDLKEFDNRIIMNRGSWSIIATINLYVNNGKITSCKIS